MKPYDSPDRPAHATADESIIDAVEIELWKWEAGESKLTGRDLAARLLAQINAYAASDASKVRVGS